MAYPDPGAKCHFCGQPAIIATTWFNGDPIDLCGDVECEGKHQESISEDGRWFKQARRRGWLADLNGTNETQD